MTHPGLEIKKIGFQDIGYFLLATLFLCFCQFLIIFIPFAKYYPFFEDKQKKDTGKTSDEKILIVRKALLRGVKYLPWDGKCLVQALAGKMLLRKFKMPGTIYLGVAKNTGKMEAHAWLMCGNHFISGKEGHKNFTVVQIIS